MFTRNMNRDKFEEEIEIANFVQVSFVEITVSYLRRKTCCELHAIVRTKVAVKRGRTNTMNES